MATSLRPSDYHRDEDRENQFMGKQSSSSLKGMSGPQNRSVLGDLSNTGSGAYLPSRKSTLKSAQGFTVYEDAKDLEPRFPLCNSSRSNSRAPLREMKSSPSNLPEFWADKVAKLPLVTSSDSGNYSSYRLGSELSSEDCSPQKDEEDDPSPMILDSSSIISHENSWRVPPLISGFSQVTDVSQYTLDILHYLKSTETKLLPKWNYMTKQPDISFMMRSILVDWLVEVGEEYKLSTETLYLAVNYIDRFLSYMSVQRAKLQLVGTACMFISAKYEEIYPPDVNEFTYITDDTYNKKQVLRMEHLVLKVLGFDLSVPTAYFFVNQFARLSNCSDQILFLAQYLCELTLLDAERYLCYNPSIIGASAVTLARHTCHVSAWPEEMVGITGYTLAQFQSCLVGLHQTFTDAPKCAQQAMRDKYKHDKYLRVSELAPVPISNS